VNPASSISATSLSLSKLQTRTLIASEPDNVGSQRDSRKLRPFALVQRTPENSLHRRAHHCGNLPFSSWKIPNESSSVTPHARTAAGAPDYLEGLMVNMPPLQCDPNRPL
jgi:hypothetical protein